MFSHHLHAYKKIQAKILPLRLYVDQDALDFLKKFFSFKQPEEAPPTKTSDEIFFRKRGSSHFTFLRLIDDIAEHVEIFPIDIKLDYKPRRVDYRALKEGRTIELMNFFHFDGAEMTLRHITLKGVGCFPGCCW